MTITDTIDADTTTKQPTSARGRPVLDQAMLDQFREWAAVDDRNNEFFHDTHARLVEIGHYTCNLPTEVGGGGLDLLETGRRQRLLARYAPAPALATCMHLYWTGAAADLHRMGESGLEHVLARAADGEIFASGHAEAGNDLPLMLSTTTAEPVPGGWRITGRKHFGSLGPIWDHLGFHAMDTSDPDGPKIVHGFAARPEVGVTVVPNWDTIAMRASQSHDTVFESVFVPDEHVAAVVPAGTLDAPSVGAAFVWADSLINNVYIGIAERAVELAVASLRQRRSIGLDGRTLAHNPMLQHQVAEMWIDLESVRGYVDNLARDWVDGVDHGAEWDLKTTVARQRTNEMTRRVVDTAMDVAGGSSVRSTAELSRLLRDSRAGAYPPPADAFAHEIVAKGVLGIDPDGPRW
jgi:alkylation response protein AidB-like acyl-CoA dehydrogenase